MKTASNSCDYGYFGYLHYLQIYPRLLHIVCTIFKSQFQFATRTFETSPAVAIDSTKLTHCSVGQSPNATHIQLGSTRFKDVKGFTHICQGHFRDRIRKHTQKEQTHNTIERAHKLIENARIVTYFGRFRRNIRHINNNIYILTWFIIVNYIKGLRVVKIFESS